MPLEATGLGEAAVRAVSDDEWAALARERIFFAHQSVGRNIVTGIAEWIRSEPRIGLTVQHTRDLSSVAGGALIHDDVGSNGDAVSKTDTFVSILCEPAAATVTMAMQKFCYADFGRGVDSAAMFEAYAARIELLRSARPGLSIVHVTAPVIRVESSLRRLVRRLRRRPTLLDRAHGVERFNRLLRERYGARDPIFDLAAVESTRPNGERVYVDLGRNRVPLLAAEYTDDGGHLNVRGRRAIAGAFLAFLATQSGRGPQRNTTNRR